VDQSEQGEGPGAAVYAACTGLTALRTGSSATCPGA
jgi:hypothetical protein